MPRTMYGLLGAIAATILCIAQCAPVERSLQKNTVTGIHPSNSGSINIFGKSTRFSEDPTTLAVESRRRPRSCIDEIERSIDNCKIDSFSQSLNLAYIDPISSTFAFEILATVVGAVLISLRRLLGLSRDGDGDNIKTSGSKNLWSAIRFLSKPSTLNPKVVIFLEGNRDWPYLEPVVKLLADTSGVEIIMASGENSYINTSINLKIINVSSLFARRIFFKLVKADLLLTTVTDLGTAHFPKPASCQNCIYIFHSVVSTHVVYSEAAFDNFDTIMCVGPHQVKEIRARESLLNLKSKALVSAGYPYLETLSRIYAEARESRDAILLAPSWGRRGAIEHYGVEIIQAILRTGSRVILRPHPETIKRAPELLAAIVSTLGADPRFELDMGAAQGIPPAVCDALVCDWSGIAIEMAIMTSVPIVFLDIPQKVRNPNWKALGIPAIEVTIRDRIGPVLDIDQIARLPEFIQSAKQDLYLETRSNIGKDMLFNYLRSAPYIASYVLNCLKGTAQ